MTRQMKDSGVQWIGEIPSNWTCCKQKYLITLLNGRAYKDSEFEEDGKYKILRVGNLFTNPIWYTSSLELEPNKYCQDGDLLYSWSMSYAPVIWHGEKVIYHYHIWKTVLTEEISKMFAYYYFISLTNALQAEIHETTMGFITMGVMNNANIAFPSLQEQIAIANFLDTKCAEIDGLLEDLDAEVKTLTEYKKSIIAETVTHGLNPNASLIPTNLGWIDAIPKHWGLEKFRYKLRPRRISGQGDKQVLSVYREFGVIPKDSRDDNHNRTSDDTSNYKYVRPNDFVINKMKAWQGSMGVSQYEGIVSPAYFVYEFSDDSYNPRYFHYFMRNANNIPEYRRLSGGIREGQWDLSPYDLGNMPIVVPPKTEQNEIVNYLDEKCVLIEKSIEEKLLQIEKLKEHKASFIYEYVTGKKQVI